MQDNVLKSLHFVIVSIAGRKIPHMEFYLLHNCNIFSESIVPHNTLVYVIKVTKYVKFRVIITVFREENLVLSVKFCASDDFSNKSKHINWIWGITCSNR